jgi:molybdopterin-guanine dinucleotide biosynthesis protein A
VSGVTAVILAGGRGERLGGVIKANLTIGGVRLLERVTAALSGADTILVAHGSIAPEKLDLLTGQVAIPDLASPYAGPLAGLAAAVDWGLTQVAPPEILVLAAVDTPYLPPDYVGRLTRDLGLAALAQFEGQPYPTSSAWRFEALRNLASTVLAGTAPHSLKRLADQLGAASVDFPPHAGGDPFANANTPADLLALQGRADG